MAENDANQNQKLLTSTLVLLEESLRSPENVTVTSSALLLPQVQPQVAAQVPVYSTKVSPHSYLIFSTIVAILCGNYM